MFMNVASVAIRYAARQRHENANRIAASAEQRVQVALVDAGRHDEERERQHAHADEDREPVRACGRRASGDDHEQEQPEEHAADHDRRERPDLRPTASASAASGRRGSTAPLVAVLSPLTGNSAHRL